MEGNIHNLYEASASSSLNTFSQPFRAFDGVINKNDYNTGWYAWDDSGYETSGFANNLFSTTVSGIGSIYGEWVQLYFKGATYPINKIEIFMFSDAIERVNEKIYLVGSNDNLNWNLIYDSYTALGNDMISYTAVGVQRYNIQLLSFNNNTSYYPAAFNNTIAVGSTNPNDNRTVPFFWSSTSGSNYGNHIDVVAPGNYIYGLSHTSNSGYETYWGGTSQATPLVSGIVSLMLSLNPNLTVDQINIILRNTAEDQIGNSSEDTFGWDQYYGAGRVNAFNALSYVQSLSNENIIYNEDIKIYPNPVNETLNFKSSVNPSNFNISIHDITGRLVKDYYDVNDFIDVSQLKNGVYILSINYDKNKITLIKIKCKQNSHQINIFTKIKQKMRFLLSYSFFYIFS
jgi:subtilisin family serine protease